MKSVTAEKVTTLEEQREGEVVAEEEVVKVTGEGGGGRRWRRIWESLRSRGKGSW